MLLIRPAQASDAAAFRTFHIALMADPTMLLTPAESAQRSEAEVAANFERTAAANNQCCLLALQGDEIAGFLGLTGGMAQRNCGNGYIVTGVAAAFRRQGIARKLFAEAESWARAHAFWRLELTVMSHNQPAIALYEGLGFEKEGCLRRSLRIDDQWVDQYQMGKLLDGH